MSSSPYPPELVTSQWFNCEEGQSLAMHRGKVIVVEVFQMLCPGCVSHSLPQAQRIHQSFSRDDVVVLGLHSVFEHHDAMMPVSLKAFLYEYGLSFPVGVDSPGKDQHLPQTMAAYGMQGTPTLLLIGRDGRLAAHQFGQVSDLDLGARIGLMMTQSMPADLPRQEQVEAGEGCGEDICPVPEQ